MRMCVSVTLEKIIELTQKELLANSLFPMIGQYNKSYRQTNVNELVSEPGMVCCLNHSLVIPPSLGYTKKSELKD